MSESDEFDMFEATREVHDTPAEVDAAFRAMRKVAFTHLAMVFVLIAAFPVLSLTLTWWTEAGTLSDLSPAFLVAAAGLYIAFAIAGIAGAARSSAIESRMLGGTARGEAVAPREDDW